MSWTWISSGATSDAQHTLLPQWAISLRTWLYDVEMSGMYGNGPDLGLADRLVNADSLLRQEPDEEDDEEDDDRKKEDADDDDEGDDGYSE